MTISEERILTGITLPLFFVGTAFNDRVVCICALCILYSDLATKIKYEGLFVKCFFILL